jgi:acyl carrier protein
MKTRKEITVIVSEILIDKLGVDESEIKEEADLQNDLGMDSLDAIELIMEFEKEFLIGIPDDDVSEVKTVKGIIDYLMEKHV